MWECVVKCGILTFYSLATDWWLLIVFRSEKLGSVRQGAPTKTAGDSGSLTNLLDAINKEFPLPGRLLVMYNGGWMSWVNWLWINYVQWLGQFNRNDRCHDAGWERFVNQMYRADVQWLNRSHTSFWNSTECFRAVALCSSFWHLDCEQKTSAELMLSIFFS